MHQKIGSKNKSKSSFNSLKHDQKRGQSRSRNFNETLETKFNACAGIDLCIIANQKPFTIPQSAWVVHSNTHTLRAYIHQCICIQLSLYELTSRISNTHTCSITGCLHVIYRQISIDLVTELKYCSHWLLERRHNIDKLMEYFNIIYRVLW
jgi:hypothetical protein